MKELKERLNKVYSYLYQNGVVHSQRELSDKLGFTTTTVSLAMNGNERALTKNFIRKVCEVFTMINYDYVMNGRGDMLVGDIVTPVVTSYGSLPVLSLHSIDNEINIFTIEKMTIPAFSELGADFLVRANDSSMSQRYCVGDLLACKKIEELSFFQSGRVYVIGTNSQGGIIRKIEETKEDYVICKSENPKYGDFKLPKSEIRSLYLVVGLIRIE